MRQPAVTEGPLPALDEAQQRQVAASLLEVYAFRANRDDEHLLSVGSYMAAVAGRLLGKGLCEQLDYARCALERAAHRLPPDADCTRALRALAPHLAALRICEECGSWRSHALACSQAREPVIGWGW